MGYPGTYPSITKTSRFGTRVTRITAVVLTLRSRRSLVRRRKIGFDRAGVEKTRVKKKKKKKKQAVEK